ncbi:MAG: hypothetical protein LBT84_01485 [Spirochaetia bacterium]|jgi:ATP-dependent DNA ligase|nr:hypothetical protein [Spirochaetia bacterium]
MLDKSKMNNAKGYLEGTSEAVDAETLSVAANYKKDVAKSYISLNPEQIDSRLGGTKFHVTRKLDGELAVIFYDGADIFVINTGGRVRSGLPCMDAAAKMLKSAGLKSAVIPSELHVDGKERGRVFDVLAALADPSKHKQLRLSPFDIVSLNGAAFKADSYEATYKRLTEIFTGDTLCQPVQLQNADSKANVKEIYASWVEQEGAEGLVVRSELPLIYKIKPRYTIDTAVIGFSEGIVENRGQIRTLLIALMPEEGLYQIIGHVGGGFEDNQRKELFEKLMPMKIESSFIETDSNHTAFHMIRPEIVIELNINDVLFETSQGPIGNAVLEINEGAWRRMGGVNGISVVFPVFSRIRDDKKVSAADVRFAQVNEIGYSPLESKQEIEKDSAPSELLHREVYKKAAGAKLMVQKFLVWKTNKGKSTYPAYVLSYTNFSSDRKDPLQSDVYVSDDREQIMEILEKTRDIKKGWEQVV